MPNAIKYSTTIPTGSLLKGTVVLGVTTASISGPTSTTGWYYGPNPVAGKYQIIETAASGDPDVYCPQSDAELIQFVKTKGATGANTASLSASLAWIGTQSNLMAANFEYENIVTSGSLLNLDAGFVGSYPTTASNWYDISGNASNGTLTNGPTFDSANSGSIVFDGTNDYISLGITPTNLRIGTGDFTINTWVKLTTQTINPGDASYRFIIGNKNALAAASGYSLIWNNQFNKFLFSTANGSTSSQIFCTNTWASLYDVWANVVMIRQNGSTNNGCFYINNIYEPIASALTILDVTSNTAMNMGNTSDLYSPYWTKITYGTTQIYNRALTASEVLQNYNATKGRFGL